MTGDERGEEPSADPVRRGRTSEEPGERTARKLEAKSVSDKAIEDEIDRRISENLRLHGP